MTRNLSKSQWKNLWHSFRWMRNRVEIGQALDWIGHFSTKDEALVEMIVFGRN